MGKNKIGPLGTPLGNPLKHWGDQKEALMKAEGGRSIMNYEIAKEADRLNNLQPLPPVGPDNPVAPVNPIGPNNPIDPRKIGAGIRRF